MSSKIKRKPYTFEINNHHWTIIEVSKAEIIASLTKHTNDSYVYVYGYCLYPTQTIYINSEVCQEQKVSTLQHELTHCWLWNYCHLDTFTEENVCDVVSGCYKFIDEQSKNYFAKTYGISI